MADPAWRSILGTKSILAAMGAALSMMGACAPPLLSLSPAPRAFTVEDYEGQYEDWTRSVESYNFSRLRTVLHATATFQSWEFRSAYVVRYAADHGLDTEQRTALLRTALADAQEHHRFFVTFAGEYARESDLTGRNSAWRLLLVDEAGRTTEPEAIERIRRPSAAERTYFPSVSQQRDAFRVSFLARREDGSATIPAGAHYAILRFTGALGTVDLRWRFLTPD